MIGDAQFEVLWQLNRESHGSFPRQGSHRIRVFHLRNVVAEEKIRLEEKIGMLEWCPGERLKFDVAADDVTCERAARRLRLIAAAKIRLVVRRGELEIAVTAKEVLAEKQAYLVVVFRGRNLRRVLGCCFRGDLLRLCGRLRGGSAADE